MTEKILAVLVQFITHVIDVGGYAGIVALMGIESACIPLPSEIIMPFAGLPGLPGALQPASGWRRRERSAATWARWLPTGSAPRAGGRWWSDTAIGC